MRERHNASGTVCRTAALTALTLAAAMLFSGCALLTDILSHLTETLPPDRTVSPGPQATPAATAPAAPFDFVPDIPEYTLPPEEFPDDLEREASEIIDPAIARALAYVSVMKDSRHSYTVHPFEEDANGYIAKLNSADRELFRRFVEAGKRGEALTVGEQEYDALAKEYAGKREHELVDAYFAIYEPLQYCEPGLSSYYGTNGESYISGDYNSSHMRNVFGFFYDPYRFMDSSVASGAVTMEDVLHGAELLDRVVKRVVRFMPEGLTAYDRYYYLAAVLSEKVMYDDRPANCFSAFGALVCGKAVCEGYTAAYYLLCREAGLWCAYRDGLPEGAGHTWNMVKLDSGIYNVDVTWCDGKGNPYERPWYRCFMRSDAVFEADGHCALYGVAGVGESELSPYEK
ncbi:MAG: hypothetical protein IJM24_11080 [Clostridia bacterium]|nr:hypothetical protein [Clostridia bacterium]